jgi:hypothetical protein
MLIHAIEMALPDLPEDSDDRRNALNNLYTVRRALAERQNRSR